MEGMPLLFTMVFLVVVVDVYIISKVYVLLGVCGISRGEASDTNFLVLFPSLVFQFNACFDKVANIQWKRKGPSKQFYLFIYLFFIDVLFVIGLLWTGIEYCRGFHFVLRGNVALGTDITLDYITEGVNFLETYAPITNECEAITWAYS